MNRLPIQKRVQILQCLVEGCSMRATSRMVDVSINTVTKFLVDLGAACCEYQDKALRNLPCRNIQLDEIWSFTYAKEKNVASAKRPAPWSGDTWTWVAIDRDTKLVASWLVGGRSGYYANMFVRDLASRLQGRVQLTSDGHRVYLQAVEDAFGADVDYAMLVKLYGSDGESTPERKYSPAECTGSVDTIISGKPDPTQICTSHVERQNLTMRMNMRRFTRLTNGFSKKVENHMYAVAIHYMHYNFGRVHKSLRVTPAMEAKVSDHVWSLEEIVSLAD